ncbi:MAG: hypothetical protein JJT94_11565 [Bernardetiaceae bacterium]|nr:hypothetical protein [Bernardetiaceae bacterium]
MMTHDDLQALQEYGFQLKYEDSTGKIYVSSQKEMFICEIKEPYMPIEDFKNLLIQKGLLMKEYPCRKFIFDKREIRGFHQPSMEWYYSVWKPKMQEKFGLSVHRKLFTKEAWFRKSVEAGRAEIRKKYPDSPCHQMDIQVSETIREAINN